MKKTLFSVCLLLFIVSALYLPDSLAQDYAQWRLPEGAKVRLGKGKINEVQLSPDGTRLAVATSIGIWLYDAHSGEALDLLNPMKEVLSISFNPDGAMLAGGSRNGTIHLWDTTTGKEIKTLIGHNGRIVSVAFNPDGRTLASGSWDDTIRLWDTATGKHIKTFLCGGIPFALVFNPDGTTLAGVMNDPPTVWWDPPPPIDPPIDDPEPEPAPGAPSLFPFPVDPGNFICLWDVATDHIRLTTSKGIYSLAFSKLTTSKGIYSLAFSPDGATLAGGTWNGIIHLWDASTGKEIKTLKGHTDAVMSLAFSPHGTILVSGSQDNTIRLWDATTEEYIKILRHTNGVRSLAFSPNGLTFVSGGWDKTIHLWDAATGKYIRSFKGHTEGINGLMFSLDGATLFSMSHDKTIRLWKTTTGEHRKTLIGYMEDLQSLAFGPDGIMLATGENYSFDKEYSIYLWNTATGEHIKTFTGYEARAESLAFSPDRTILANGGYRTINLWNVATGEHIKTLRGPNKANNERLYDHGEEVSNLTFSPDGTILASSNYNDTIKLWNVATGEYIRGLTGHAGGLGGAVSSLAFHPDGTLLASGGYYSSYPNKYMDIHLWDVATGEHIKKFTKHIGIVYSLVFSPDGTILASGGSTNIHLWDVATGERIGMLEEHEGLVHSLAFSQDGTTLAGGYASIREGVSITGSLWNVATGEHIRMLTTIHKLDGQYGHRCYRVSFNTDGATLASAGRNSEGIVLLWDLDAAPLLPGEIPEDVNDDGVLNIQDLVLVAANFGQTGLNAADVNGDGIVDIGDLVKVAGMIAATAAAPPMNSPALATLTTADVQQWLSQTEQLDIIDPVSQRGIRFLEQLLTALTPKETALLPNYPNPFNPETWIPYQLAEPAKVTLTIYAVDGTVTRTLELGHQPIGVYHDRHRAARWDGKNERGEAVASGVYFYTLTAGEFKATRKMIVQK